MTRLDFDTLCSSADFADVVELEAIAALASDHRAKHLSILPRWVRVCSDGRIFVASWPWFWHEPTHRAGLAVRKTAGFPRVDVLDPKWQTLLELALRGRSSEAAEDEFGMVLPNELGEIKSPILAALIGTVLVQNAESSRRQVWDDWIDDMARSHVDVSDCAAVLAERHLQCGRYAEGGEWLRESVCRGLPYLTSTFRLLSLGFCQLEDDAQYRRISRALVSLDLGQPFTVLSLPQHGGSEGYSAASRRTT